MELSDYIRVARQRWVSIFVIALVVFGSVAAYTFIQTPQYDSRAQLFVSVGGDSDTTAEVVQGNSFAEKRVASYVNLATSPRVLDVVASELGLEMSGVELRASVTASSPPETVLIDITAMHSRPETAAAIANSVARHLSEAVNEVEHMSLVRLTVFQEAVVPMSPASPRVFVNLALGLLAGALLGAGYALLREILDTRLRSEEDVKRIAAAGVLGTFASESGLEKTPLVTQGDPYSARAESFRQLRTHLHFTNMSGGSQSIVVSSAIPGEGKTSTAVNLAIMLAESGTRVLLVDADLRRPRVAKYLGIEGIVGLSTVLTNQVTLEESIQTWGPGQALHVLTSGRSAPNPSELLDSPSMEKLLLNLEEQYEVVIIDAPPLLPVTDPAVLGSIASGIMLVVSSDGRTRKDELRLAIANIESVNARLLGVVINRVPFVRGSYSYYDYKPELQTPKRRKSRKNVAGMRHV